MQDKSIDNEFKNETHSRIGFFEVSHRARDETDEQKVFVVAVIYQNERLRVGAGWSQNHLLPEHGDWPKFSDISGKHKVPSAYILYISPTWLLKVLVIVPGSLVGAGEVGIRVGRRVARGLSVWHN